MYKHTDGAEFKGMWVEDKQEGKGIETWPDGARYEGDYKLGQKDGKIFLKILKINFFLLQKLYFINEYVFLLKSLLIILGVGNFKWADGSKFEGEF